eukprot:Tamp_10279.p1 GENE.Tamp_10279~~Tamp_10279.p1  ORF type:complete len:566 (+),score=151.58 Tamp_10279:96-1700(+)
MALGPDFFKRDAQGFAGGVELGFMSATASRQVALEFAGMEAEEGKDATKQLPTLYVIDVGKMSIGANIADISQFEGEEEFVYPMLTRLELTKEPELSPDGTVSLIHLKLTVNQRSTTVEDAEQARRRFLTRLAHSLQWSLRNWARQRAGLTERLRPQVVGVLRRLLDEVRGAELAVLNTNEGYGQVFERIMRIWEEALRQEVVETLWQDGEQQPHASRAAVRRFKEAIDAAQDLCADSKEVRDRMVGMRRVVMRATGGGKDEEEEAAAKLRLAFDLKELGEDHEALKLAHAAVDLFTKVGGHQHPSVADSRQLIGIIYKTHGRYQEALVQYQKALEVFLASYGPAHASVGEIYANIGNVYSHLARHEEALVQHQKAHEVFLAFHGPEHRFVGQSYDNMGVQYRQMGRYEEALAQYQKAREVFLSLYGQKHILMAVGYNNTGNVLSNMGRNEEALEMFSKALEIRISLVGEDHLDVAATYSSMAAPNLSQGKTVQGIEMLTKAYDIELKLLGPDHERTKKTLWLRAQIRAVACRA